MGRYLLFILFFSKIRMETSKQPSAILSFRQKALPAFPFIVFVPVQANDTGEIMISPALSAAKIGR